MIVLKDLLGMDNMSITSELASKLEKLLGSESDSDTDDYVCGSNEEYDPEDMAKFELLHNLYLLRKQHPCDEPDEEMTVCNSYAEIKHVFDARCLEESFAKSKREAKLQEEAIVRYQLYMIGILYPDFDIPSWTIGDNIDDLIKIRNDVISSSLPNMNLIPSLDVFCTICMQNTTDNMLEFRRLVASEREKGGNDKTCDIIDKFCDEVPSNVGLERLSAIMMLTVATSYGGCIIM